ncbi:GNAT family N-acetyltransferase [Actinomadura rugatobispora]|uniref:GNAT family N-acetyltransferase n=1 Tax=Actinomadura rugatobispora TaxID=1994 RepID=A0ABW1A7U1_9ACTN|nr:GNAT family N-acetyltransferase [Actinomadura rugatobispora]
MSGTDAETLDGTPVRRLRVGDDLAACTELAQDRDWPPEEHKWRLLFRIGRVYGVDDPASPGRLAGTVVSTPYGRDVSAISMVLVARRYERQGLGGRLMRHALDHCGTAGACLTATEYGRVLYERLGFRAVGKCVTYKGEPSGRAGSAGAASRRFEDGDMADVLALDAEAFGAPRTELLRRLPSFCEDFRVVRGEGDGPLLGFGGAWRNGDLLMVGPVTGRDATTALGLVEALALTDGVAGTVVRLDVDRRHPELLEWAERNGMKVAFTTTVMEYGASAGGDQSRLFVPVMQALG